MGQKARFLLHALVESLALQELGAGRDFRVSGEGSGRVAEGVFRVVARQGVRLGALHPDGEVASEHLPALVLELAPYVDALWQVLGVYELDTLVHQPTSGLRCSPRRFRSPQRHQAKQGSRTDPSPSHPDAPSSCSGESNIRACRTECTSRVHENYRPCKFALPSNAPFARVSSRPTASTRPSRCP